MTNLIRWLMYASIYIIPYLCIVSKQVRTPTTDRYFHQIQSSPVMIAIIFAVYSVATVLYRTLTFNDCPEASKELHREIGEARIDLMSKGFRFRD